ncbi:MAG: gas vesicle protein GvpG [Pseudomonadota bacterium]
MIGLVARLVALPVNGPIGGAVWTARQIAKSVEQERNSPAAIRAALRDAEARLLDGTLSEEDYDKIEDDLLERLEGTAG